MRRKICISGLTLLLSLLLGSCTDLLIVAHEADAVFVEADTAELSVVFEAGDSPSEVTGDLTLPTAIQETTIVWHSSNTSVVTDTGIITQPAFDAGSVSVILEATITAGGETRMKTFTLIVLPLEPTDAQAIGADTLALEATLGGTDVASFVTQDIVLPSTGLWGTTITWVSNKPGIISGSGDVTSSTSDETVTMTAIISRGDGTSATKEFIFTVKATGTVAVTIALPVTPGATDLVFIISGDAVITTFEVATGSSVTVNTSFAGTYAWYVDSGTSSISTAFSCSLAGNAYPLGFHTLVIDAVADGISFSGQILFKVVTP